jgi:hypothetical protein
MVEIVNINFEVINGRFVLGLPDNIRTSNIVNQDQVKKEVLKVMGLDEKNINDFNFFAEFTPESEKKQLVNDWIKNGNCKCLIQVKPKKRTDEKYPLIGIISSNESIISPIINSYFTQKMDDMTEKHEKLMKETKNQHEKLMKETINQMTEKHEKQFKDNMLKLDARQNIHCLANFVSLFRNKILEQINKDNQKSYENWKSLLNLENKTKTELINGALKKLHYSIEDWEMVANLSSRLNRLKNDIIEFKYAYEYLDEIKGSSFNQYYEPLLRLVKLFEENEW